MADVTMEECVRAGEMDAASAAYRNSAARDGDGVKRDRQDAYQSELAYLEELACKTRGRLAMGWQWQTETCETCRYAGFPECHSEGSCRAHPPALVLPGKHMGGDIFTTELWGYPPVERDTAACAEWKDKVYRAPEHTGLRQKRRPAMNIYHLYREGLLGAPQSERIEFVVCAPGVAKARALCERYRCYEAPGTWLDRQAVRVERLGRCTRYRRTRLICQVFGGP